MATIQISVAGEARVEARLTRMQMAATNALPAFLMMQESFEEEETRLFETEGAAGAGAWAPLSPAYEAEKSRTHPGETILQREHRLVESLIDPSGPDAIRQLTPHMAAFGTSVEYAMAHQEGVPSRNLPARPPLDVSWDVLHRWTEILKEHVMGHEGVAALVAGL